MSIQQELSLQSSGASQGKNVVRGRFAPSPSGRMHVGNVFCALLAWLSCRAQHGQMVLRIEDLDQQRCTLAYAQQLEDDLRWLGLDWDEGGLAAGAAYCQSACSAQYAYACDTLAAQGHIYPCFCTRAQLHAASAPHASDGQIIYNGTCRTLTKQQVLQRTRTRTPALRLRVPNDDISFVDGLYGVVGENLQQQTGDFLLRRSDGMYAYQLAVVVDDGRMGITQVVRGNDLLSSTARQLYLYQLLQLTPPQFTHIPLLCAPDGRRLAKRDGDLDMGHIRQTQTSAQKLLGQLAYLAGLLPQPQEITAQSLIALFQPRNIPTQNIVLTPAMYRTLAGDIG